MRRQGYVKVPAAAAFAAILLMIFCSICASAPQASLAGRLVLSQTVFGAESGSVSLPSSKIPRASDENVPSGLTVPSSGANFAKIPARTNYCRTASTVMFRMDWYAAQWAGLLQASPAAAAVRFGAPEFTLFSYIKTTHKRE